MELKYVARNHAENEQIWKYDHSNSNLRKIFPEIQGVRFIKNINFYVSKNHILI